MVPEFSNIVAIFFIALFNRQLIASELDSLFRLAVSTALPKTCVKFGPIIPNPNVKAADSRKGRLSTSLALGAWIFDSALYLTQYSVIKVLLQGAARRCSQVNTKVCRKMLFVDDLL